MSTLLSRFIAVRWLVWVALSLASLQRSENELHAADRFEIKELVSLEVRSVAPPPEWAVWQRFLLEALHPAAMEFVQTYTNPDHTLRWRDAWPGMDGSDDGYESWRAGMPQDVAALVKRVRPDGLTLELVNLHPAESRDVIVQAGAFGEHRFTKVRSDGLETDVNRKFFHVKLSSGAAGTLEIRMKRYANPPTYAFPWHGKQIPAR